jgi:16S rRNA (uracil1498-N3)-methyltransferase
MSAPLFLVPAVLSGPLTLDGPEGRHAATVQRLRVGESVLLSDGRGAVATAVITAVGRDRVELDVAAASMIAPPNPRIVVAQALAKGDRAELAVQAMTEVGVDEIVPWSAARCVVQWRGDRGERSRERWQSTIREAAKQSRRCWIPALAPLASTAALIGRVRTLAAARSGAAALILHEAATTGLGALELPVSGEILLVVGPEGGLSDEEVAAFIAAGATAVRLGAEVLRTSTAGAAAIAALSVRLGRW